MSRRVPVAVGSPPTTVFSSRTGGFTTESAMPALNREALFDRMAAEVGVHGEFRFGWLGWQSMCPLSLTRSRIMKSSSRGSFCARCPSVVGLGFLTLVFAVVSSWQSPALGQDSCSDAETIKTKCRADGDLVKKISVSLKKGQSNTTYVCKLDTGEEKTKDTNRRGKAKFKFKFRKNKPACVPGNSASVGVVDQGDVHVGRLGRRGRSVLAHRAPFVRRIGAAAAAITCR